MKLMKPPLQAGLPDLFPWRREWPIVLGWPEQFTARMGPDEIKVEEFTENGTYVVRAELPGVDPEQDIDIEVTGGNLLIRAERRNETKVGDNEYQRTELRYGAFYRTLALPAGAKEGDIKATYNAGILEVRVPLAPVKGTKVKVTQT
jgi:HSP20 family molecular chaperone IbpA